MKSLTTLQGIMLGSLVLVSSTTVLAQNSDITGYDPARPERERVRHEATGVLGGLLLGGALAGPPGAILSATAGALFGNHVSAQNEQDRLADGLARAQRRLQSLEEENRQLALALEEARSDRYTAGTAEDRNRVSLADTALTLHFRTDSTALEPHYLRQLEEFARLARDVPEAIIQITGYADTRGGEIHNLALSEGRIRTVEETLRDMDVANTTFQTVARGESRPLVEDGTLEGHFFNRRVDLRVRSNHIDYLTSN